MDNKGSDNNVILLSYKLYDELQSKYNNLEMSYNLLESDYEDVLSLCLDFQQQLIDHNLMKEKIIEVNDIKTIESIDLDDLHTTDDE